MVDTRRIRQLLDRIADEEAHLRRLGELDSDHLLANHDLLSAVKYGFVVIIELAIDVGRHVIASEGLAVPDSYAEVFTILGDSGFLTERDAAALADAARFRNLLVHQYTKVDDRRVVDYLTTRLDDLKSFRMGVAKAITDQK